MLVQRGTYCASARSCTSAIYVQTIRRREEKEVRDAHLYTSSDVERPFRRGKRDQHAQHGHAVHVVRDAARM
jgi:hypothetical protein